MLTYLLLTLTWFAIVFLPPYIAYRRPVGGHLNYAESSVDTGSESSTAA